ncbi:hypothetical protein FI667_g13949, partial [Globisporangium splendens]
MRRQITKSGSVRQAKQANQHIAQRDLGAYAREESASTFLQQRAEPSQHAPNPHADSHTQQQQQGATLSAEKRSGSVRRAANSKQSLTCEPTDGENGDGVTWLEAPPCTWANGVGATSRAAIERSDMHVCLHVRDAREEHNEGR